MVQTCFSVICAGMEIYMSKKFGKLLLFGAAAATAAAATIYYLKKKDTENQLHEDEDFDDFSDEASEEDTTRSYVQLNRETAGDCAKAEDEACCGEAAECDCACTEAEDADAECECGKAPCNCSEDTPADTASVEEFFDEADEAK